MRGTDKSFVFTGKLTQPLLRMQTDETDELTQAVLHVANVGHDN